jgi:outer membrane protein assembly factor BamB
MPTRCFGSFWRWAALVGLLMSVWCVPAGRVGAFGCGPSPEVGKPREVAHERWRYVFDGAGSYSIVHADEGGVTALMFTPGCAVSFAGLASLDPATGNQRWLLTREDVKGDVGGAVQTGDLILLEADAALVAVDATTGEELWRHPFGQYPSIASLTEGAVFVTDEDELVAIDSATGETLWHTGLPSYAEGWQLSADSTLVGILVDTRKTFDVTVAGYDSATGEERWRTAVGEGSDQPVIARLVAGNEGTVIASLFGFDLSSSLVAIDATSGEIAWRADQLESLSLATIESVIGTAGDVVVVTTTDADQKHGVAGLDVATGAVRWQTSRLDGVLVVDDGLIVGPRTNTDGTGGLGALDPASGTLLWSAKITGVDDPQGVTGGTSTLADGLVVVALAPSADGARTRAEAVAVDATTGGLVWKADYREFEALFVEGAGAGAVFFTAVKGTEATLLALDTD